MTQTPANETSSRVMSRWNGWLVGLPVVSLLSVIVLSYSAAWWWPGGVAEYTRFHTALALGLLAMLAIATKHQRWAAACLIAATANLVTLAILTPPSTTPTSLGELRVMHLNIDRNNQQIERVHDAIQHPRDGRPPDIVCLQEFTPGNAIWVEFKLAGYELVASEPRDDSRGVAILMRSDTALELIEWRELQWLPGETDRPTLAAVFRVPGKPEQLLTVLSVHTKRPASPSKSRVQQREFAAAADWCAGFFEERGAEQHLLVIGDFNTTPWSVDYRRFIERSGLLHVGGTLNQDATYPSFLPWPLRVPIDLAAVSPNLAATEPIIGPRVGSDHRPIYIDVSLKLNGKRQPN